MGVSANPYEKTLSPLWENEDRKYVFIDFCQLKAVADLISNDVEPLVYPAWNFEGVQPLQGCELEEWLEYLCWVNSINFCFTDCNPPHKPFTIEIKTANGETIQHRGASALGASFLRAKREGFEFSADRLVKFKEKELAYILRPIDSSHTIFMFDQRLRILRQNAQVLIKKYDGKWTNLFDAGSWAAFAEGGGVVERLVGDFLTFIDVRKFNGHMLKFHKRAQLIALMHQGRAINSNGKYPLLERSEYIGPICDYRVPQALRLLGVLKYDESLENYIIQRFLILPNSRYEIEIRVATWRAMSELCKLLNSPMGPVDFKMWLLGRKAVNPHHLTPTTDY